MSVIVDTSVWSYVLRRGTPRSDPQAEKLVRLLEEGSRIMLLGVILQEVLQGIRSEKQFRQVRDHLERFSLLALERADYLAAAELRNQCLARGVDAGTIDFQIAAACLQHDCALLTADRDFTRIASCCPLQLL